MRDMGLFLGTVTYINILTPRLLTGSAGPLAPALAVQVILEVRLIIKGALSLKCLGHTTYGVLLPACASEQGYVIPKRGCAE